MEFLGHMVTAGDIAFQGKIASSGRLIFQDSPKGRLLRHNREAPLYRKDDKTPLPFTGYLLFTGEITSDQDMTIEGDVRLAEEIELQVKNENSETYSSSEPIKVFSTSVKKISYASGTITIESTNEIKYKITGDVERSATKLDFTGTEFDGNETDGGRCCRRGC